MEPKEPLGVLGRLIVIKTKGLPLEQETVKELQKTNWVGAEKLCRQMIEEVPFFSSGYYNLACIQARTQRTNEAFASLKQAIEHGFANRAHIERDPDLGNLRNDPRFAALLYYAATNPAPAVARPFKPGEPVRGAVWMNDDDTKITANGIFRVFYQLNPAEAARHEIAIGSDEAAQLLRQWWQAGTAAGNAGDLYDNRDGGHSLFKFHLFPQFTRVEYAPEAKELELHWGLADKLIHQGGPVLGNASVAANQNLFWRSMPRVAYTSAAGLTLLDAQYFSNQIYVYPCHHDHGPGHLNRRAANGNTTTGDVLPANTPYLIASQGSSGSDQPFLEAIAATMAAFQPATKKRLVENGMLAPAIQMIFRMSNKGIDKPADYLSGKAHPSVFDATNLNVVKMVKMAHDIPTNNLPPICTLKVLQEDRPVEGRDFFYPVRDESLFETSCAIARVMRSTQYWRRMVVSAETSRDKDGRPLNFHWAILRGNTNNVQFKYLNTNHSVVEISVAYTPRRPVEPGSPLESNRIDVGAFVDNGTYYSAPSFVTWFGLDDEQRDYDFTGRILSVTYGGGPEGGYYVDPQIALPRYWRDVYHYDAAGQMTGWTRTRKGKTEEFTAEGLLILGRDALGQPTQTMPVAYVPRSNGPSELPAIEPVPADQALKPASPQTR